MTALSPHDPMQMQREPAENSVGDSGAQAVAAVKEPRSLHRLTLSPWKGASFSAARACAPQHRRPGGV